MFNYRNTVPAILLSSIFFILLSSVSAMAGFWDTNSQSLWNQLSQEEQDLVFDQAIASMGTGVRGALSTDEDSVEGDPSLSDKALQDYGDLVTTGAGLKQLRAYADQISTGNYEPAFNATLNYTANTLASYLNDTITNQLEDGPAKTIYTEIVNRPEMLRDVSVAIFNPNNSWSDVGGLAWSNISKELKDTLTEQGKANLTDAFNYFMGNRSFMGQTPADLYLALIKAEKEFLVFLRDKIKDDAGNYFYQLYRDSGGNYDLMRDLLVLGTGYMGSGGINSRDALFTFSRDYSEEELQSLLDYCYKNNADNFVGCRSKYEAELKGKLSSAKNTAVTSLQQATNKRKNRISDFYNRLRNKLNELTKERLEITPEKIKAIIDETNNDLAELERISDSSELWCSKSEEIYKAIADMCKKLQTGKENVDELNRITQDFGGCKEIADKVLELAEMVELAKQRLDKIVRLLQEVDRLRKDSCNFKDPVNQQEAKDNLARVKAIELKFKPLVKALENEFAELDRLLRKMPSMEADVKSEIENINDDTFKDLSSKIKRLSYLLEGLKEAQEVSPYEIAEGITKLKLLRGQAARASGTWGDLIGVKQENTTPEYKILYDRIVKKLTPYSGDKSVDAILLKANTAYDKIVGCVDKPASTLDFMDEAGICNPNAINRYVNDINRKATQYLVEKAETILQECGVLKNISSANNLEQSKYIGMILDKINVGETLENLVGDFAICLLRATDNFEGDMPEDVEYAYVVVKLEGSGYYPHWAGGSHIISGSSQFIYKIVRGDEPLPTLEEISRSYKGNVCEMVNPPGFGWVEDTPPSLFDQKMPAVDLITVPYKDAEDIDKNLLYSDWKSSGSDGPSLYELKKGCK